jgi:D-methionine transport system substrate-binding protein
MKKLLSILFGFSLVAITVVGLSSCGDSRSGELGSESNPVRIGVVKSSDSQWEVLKDSLKKENIYIDLVNFEAYNEPNPATKRGELDLNEFQHLDYLAAYNNDSGDDLVAIGSKSIYPIGLYGNSSADVNSLEDIADGASIVVPNDETNLGRALYLLADNDLIKLTNAEGVLPTLLDVDPSSKVKVTGVAGAQTAHALSDPSVAGAVINNDYVKDANISETDAIARESADNDYAKRYINIWVTRKADADKDIYKKIVKVATTDQAYLDAVQADSDGSAVLVTDYTQSQLQTILDDLQTEKKNAS